MARAKIPQWIHFFFSIRNWNLLLLIKTLLSFIISWWKTIPKKEISIEPDQPFDQPLICDDEKLSKEEVRMVMKRVGIIDYDEEMENIWSSYLGAEEMSEMFNHEEPSLEEVKKVFDVFDENGDGFIDEKELLKILWSLDSEVGLEECRRMIERVDENGDGFIDLSEFLQFMENCF